MADVFTIKHDQDLLRDFEKWILVRKSLGLSSFGMNMVDIPIDGDIPEHDETERDHEEVFYVVSGEPTMVIDGAEYPLKKGSFVRIDPSLRRTIKNKGAQVSRVLIISAPRTSGYTPLDWA